MEEASGSINLALYSVEDKNQLSSCLIVSCVCVAVHLGGSASGGGDTFLQYFKDFPKLVNYNSIFSIGWCAHSQL